MPGGISLTRSQLEAVFEHAKRQQPEEACGILAGDADGSVRRVFLMENAEHSSILYMMDSAEQFEVFDQMENDGLELVAIFHSHPRSPAFPSARDLELAFYPESLYLIVSLMDGEPQYHAFRLAGGQVAEAPLTILDDQGEPR